MIRGAERQRVGGGERERDRDRDRTRERDRDTERQRQRQRRSITETDCERESVRCSPKTRVYNSMNIKNHFKVNHTVSI